MTSSQDESPASAQKSKQERIRDNQRRSRARRQEYVADLEKRLRDGHSAYRDAEIQRSAYADLQRENACLRTLLGLSGVSPELIESFIRQHAASSQQQATIDAKSYRQLKPKLPVPLIHEPRGTSISSRTSDDILDTSSTPRSVGEPITGNEASGLSGNPQILEPTASSASYYQSTLAMDDQRLHLPDDFDLGFEPLPQVPSVPGSRPQNGHCCGNFVATAPSNFQDDRNSILCSVASQLLNQLHLPAQELEQVKLRLAAGVTRSVHDAECRLNNQLLYHILNEITTQHR